MAVVRDNQTRVERVEGLYDSMLMWTALGAAGVTAEVIIKVISQ
jgi:hypothetical protein